VHHLVDPDVGTIGALARIRLALLRQGCELRLHGASGELRELLVFAGLDGVLDLEPRRQPEEREERLGVEEEGELGDPPG
jgi:hypothetical protein